MVTGDKRQGGSTCVSIRRQMQSATFLGLFCEILALRMRQQATQSHSPYSQGSLELCGDLKGGKSSISFDKYS